LVLLAAKQAWDSEDGETLKRLARVVNRLREKDILAVDLDCDWAIEALNRDPKIVSSAIERAPEAIAALTAIVANSARASNVQWREIVNQVRTIAARGAAEPTLASYALRDICFYSALGSLKAHDLSVYVGAAEGMLEAGTDFGAELFTVVREILTSTDEKVAMTAVVSCGQLIAANMGLRKPNEYEQVRERVERVVAQALSKTYPNSQKDKLINFHARVALVTDRTSPRHLIRRAA
jgi:hypothetical protein